ncbi:hypothetical protein T08_4891 [Trichinella sp. T8]|nr:hypothetical protein T08_4891 [Trichinella sp. T8]
MNAACRPLVSIVWPLWENVTHPDVKINSSNFHGIVYILTTFQAGKSNTFDNLTFTFSCQWLLESNVSFQAHKIVSFAILPLLTALLISDTKRAEGRHEDDGHPTTCGITPPKESSGRTSLKEGDIVTAIVKLYLHITPTFL